MYIYVKTERSLWTVGFYAPNGCWHVDSDHNTPDAAANRVAYLNGETNRDLLEALGALYEAFRRIATPEQFDSECEATWDAYVAMCKARGIDPKESD